MITPGLPIGSGATNEEGAPQRKLYLRVHWYRSVSMGRAAPTVEQSLALNDVSFIVFTE